MTFCPAKGFTTLSFSPIRQMMERANQLQSQDEDIIHLELGRPDFDTPKIIKDAGQASLAKGEVFYTSNWGLNDLRQAIASKLQRENGAHYQSEEVLITAGVGEAVFLSLSMLLEPGDELLLPDPSWLNYSKICIYLGARPVFYNLLEDNAFQPDPDELASLVTHRTKAIVLISPHNPTGGVLTESSLQAVAALSQKKDIIVVSDEIYEKIIFDNRRHISIASLPDMKERTIVLNGFSKAYSMTGWRLGYMAAPSKMVTMAVKLHQCIANCVPAFVQRAGVTALTNTKVEVEVEAMVMEYSRRRDVAVAAIQAIAGLHCVKPHGALYVFVNARDISCDDCALASFFLEKAGVAMTPGSAFGLSGRGYLRLSYANSYENIVIAGKRLLAAVNNNYGTLC